MSFITCTVFTPQESDPSYETFIELVHPDDRAVIGGVIEHAFRTQEPINSYLRIIRPDGAERIIHSRGNTISDSSGTPIRMHGAVQDVTERKPKEEAIARLMRPFLIVSLRCCA
jgi:PAS domain-containing protein